MRTDINSAIKILPSTAPAAAITGNGTTTGNTIDSAGYEALDFVVSTGVVTDGTFACDVYAGNASNMSDEAIVALADLIGPPGANAINIATTDDGVCERVGVNVAKIGKRYYRLKAVQTGATTGGFFSAQAILANPRYLPVAAP